MITNEQIIKALSGVIHPGSGKDIVSLGIVSGVEYTEKGISVTLSPERSNDPFLSSVRSSVVRTLKEVFGSETEVAEVKVEPKVTVPRFSPKPEQSLPGVKNIIAISSGKGGVGKTTIAVNLAIAIARKGFRTGLLDADIFGPSVPIMFDAGQFRPEVKKGVEGELIVPMMKYGVKVLSLGFFIDPDNAVIWRGPMASGFLKQLITQGDWGELDYLLVDLPPGTSDIHLTLVQEVAVTGAIVVTTPQEVALADAVKGISMFRSEKINVPVLGLVENMSWFTPAELPENKYYIFGREGGIRLAADMKVPLLGQIPLVQGICEGSDQGHPPALDDSVTGKAFAELAGRVIEKVNTRNLGERPTSKVEISK